jgi:hypothetical protein
MPKSNSTKNNKLVYSFGEQDESLEDIIMQIWNDGAEGLIYVRTDVKEFEKRIKRAIDKAKRKKGR